MNSRILFKIILEKDKIAPDIEQICKYKARNKYGCFLFGTWSSFSLWNGSGDEYDSVLNQYSGKPKKTRYAKELPYIDYILKTYFKTEKLKWVRLFLLQKGHVIPHVDFLESGEFSRIHIPIFTDMSSYHAQGNVVFHMNEGEVWHLDAADVHSTCSFSGIKRIHICLDFEPVDSYEEIFNEGIYQNESLEPTVVQRPKVNGDFYNSIYNLGPIINKNNFKDIVQLLSKLHFEKDVPIGGVFDWVIEISKRSGQKDLLNKAIDYKRYCIQERSLGEEFQFFN